MSAPSLVTPAVTPRRSGAVFGFAFLVVLFLSAAAISVPEPDASSREIIDFYAQHRGAVVVTQLFALCTVPLLVLFAVRLRDIDRPSGTALFPVAAVGGLPPLAALILTMIADPQHSNTAHAINIASGIADDLLFLIIAGFAAIVSTRRAAYRPWLRGIAVVAVVICLVRGVLGFAQVHGVSDIAAPLAFLALIAALSIRMLNRSSETTA
jgi:quinol-cytochrome oxidoreductase complex cytochrome b subunit